MLIIGSLSTRGFETQTVTGGELFSLFNINLPSHNHIHITKYLFFIRDEKYKNLGDNTDLAREMLSSSCHPTLKNARA